MPNRILKESICVSDSINELDWFGEVLFYRLIVNCDDFGRFDGRVAVIKSRLFPLKDCVTLKNIENAINKLVRAGLVVTYEANGKPFLFLPTWNEHQSVRAKRSKYPEPENICKQMQANVPVIRIQSESNPNDESRAADAAFSVVISEYMDKINATPSEIHMAELRNYCDAMGKDCCLRAISIAIDAGVRNWRYINGILRNKKAAGVRCLADWDASEAKREEDKHGTGGACGDAGSQTKTWNVRAADLGD